MRIVLLNPPVKSEFTRYDSLVLFRSRLRAVELCPSKIVFKNEIRASRLADTTAVDVIIASQTEINETFENITDD